MGDKGASGVAAASGRGGRDVDDAAPPRLSLFTELQRSASLVRHGAGGVSAAGGGAGSGGGGAVSSWAWSWLGSSPSGVATLTATTNAAAAGGGRPAQQPAVTSAAPAVTAGLSQPGRAKRRSSVVALPHSPGPPTGPAAPASSVLSPSAPQPSPATAKRLLAGVPTLPLVGSAGSTHATASLHGTGGPSPRSHRTAGAGLLGSPRPTPRTQQSPGFRRTTAASLAHAAAPLITAHRTTLSPAITATASAGPSPVSGGLVASIAAPTNGTGGAGGGGSAGPFGMAPVPMHAPAAGSAASVALARAAASGQPPPSRMPSKAPPVSLLGGDARPGGRDPGRGSDGATTSPPAEPVLPPLRLPAGADGFGGLFSSVAPPAAGWLPVTPHHTGMEDVLVMAHRIVRGVSGVISVGAVSWRGRHGASAKVNQDALLMAEHAATGSLLVAVFDGHGLNGREVSQFFKTRLPAHLFADDRLARFHPPTATTNVALPSPGGGEGGGGGAGGGHSGRSGTPGEGGRTRRSRPPSTPRERERERERSMRRRVATPLLTSGDEDGLTPWGESTTAGGATVGGSARSAAKMLTKRSSSWDSDREGAAAGSGEGEVTPPHGAAPPSDGTPHRRSTTPRSRGSRRGTRWHQGPGGATPVNGQAAGGGSPGGGGGGGSPHAGGVGAGGSGGPAAGAGGGGAHGLPSATAAAASMATSLAEARSLCDILADSLAAVEGELLRSSGIDVTLSGCTAVVALIRNGMVSMINVGDSRCVVASCAAPQLHHFDLARFNGATAPSTSTGSLAHGAAVIGVPLPTVRSLGSAVVSPGAASLPSPRRQQIDPMRAAPLRNPGGGPLSPLPLPDVSEAAGSWMDGAAGGGSASPDASHSGGGVDMGQLRAAALATEPTFATSIVRSRMLSVDHKPDTPREKQRILAAGGRVFAPRLKGAPSVRILPTFLPPSSHLSTHLPLDASAPSVPAGDWAGARVAAHRQRARPRHVAQHGRHRGQSGWCHLGAVQGGVRAAAARPHHAAGVGRPVGLGAQRRGRRPVADQHGHRRGGHPADAAGAGTVAHAHGWRRRHHRRRYTVQPGIGGAVARGIGKGGWTGQAECHGGGHNGCRGRFGSRGAVHVFIPRGEETWQCMWPCPAAL